MPEDTKPLLDKDCKTLYARFVDLFLFWNFPRRKRIAFYLNLAIGFLSAITFGFIASTQWGESNLNLALDFFIAREAANYARNPAPAEDICFIDIDYDTHRRWGEPLLTPRDRLAGMISTAAAGGAKVILLDILLEYPDTDPGKNIMLENAIAEIASGCPDTKIVFPVRIGWKGDRKKNILDKLIDANPDRFYRAVPYLSATPDDRIIRHWKLYSRCHMNASATFEVLWGSPFLAAMLMIGQESILNTMTDEILNMKGKKSNPLFQVTVPGKGRIQMNLRNTDFYLQRIRFSMVPPMTLDGIPGGNIRALHPDEVATLSEDRELAEAFFKNRLVLIGNSSPDCGDVHPTPPGMMAGMYILGNSVRTILTATQPAPTYWWFDLAIEGLALLGGAFLFVHLPSFFAQVIAWLLLLTIGGGISFWYFLKYGVFLNFVFALIGMEILAVLTEIQESVLNWLIPAENGEK